MAHITVEFVGPVRRPCVERRLAIEVPAMMQVAAILARLGYSQEEGARLTVLVNGTRAGAPAPPGSIIALRAAGRLIAVKRPVPRRPR